MQQHVPKAPALRLPEQGVDQPGSPFATCPACGVLVQVRRWYDKEGWKPLAIPESAAMGIPHSVVKGTCVPRLEAP